MSRRWAGFGIVAALTATACGAGTDESTTSEVVVRDVTSADSSSTTSAVGELPTTAAATSTTLRPATSGTAATTPMSCDGTDGRLTTPSGRSIVLRTAGIARPSPTILVIHGFTGTPEGIERTADLTTVGNAAGIAVAYPEGTSVSPGGFGWNSGASVFATTEPDDVAAISEMIEALVATGCVDRNRIMISGESNGAGMTLAALCAPQLAGAFRSAVMVVPAIDDGVLERCARNGAPDTPLVAAIGVIDTTAPVDGGNGLLPQRAWFDEVARWRGCSDVEDRGALTPFAEHAAGTDCRTCTELFAVADGLHTWPGTRFGNAGVSPGTFDLNRRIIADLLAPDPGCLSDR